MIDRLPFTLPDLRSAFHEGLRPEEVVTEAFRRLDAAEDSGILIHDARDAAIEEATALGRPDGRPLWGIPFVAKDNIDVAGMPTTAACPDFAYRPEADAFVVARLRAAGAICLGKANLDQFATGLVGVRSPYPPPRNAIDPALVPGGSSSGSAVAVAHGIAAFALGTDTAGSGRVPAALNNVVGLKPTLGALSATGVVPACRSLDTVSVFAQTVADAWSVFAIALAQDNADAYSRSVPLRALSAAPARLRIGVPAPSSLAAVADIEQADHFTDTIASLRASGALIVDLDFEPFHAVARLLYEGPWLAERAGPLDRRLVERPDTLHPTTHAVLSRGLAISGVETFEGMHRLNALAAECGRLIAGVDLLCVPTIPGEVTLAEIAADPIGPNARLGAYTNFVNLLDLCGIAVPTGRRSDGRPGSLTVLARSGEDWRAAGLALTVEAGDLGATTWGRAGQPGPEPKADADEIELAVCGAHMSGLPLNHELAGRGARFLKACRTTAEYGLHALAGGPPYRPGLVRKTGGGAAIELEVWALPRVQMGDFIAGIPAPLCIGTVALDSGENVKGFLCESRGLEGARDISHFGGWRAYLKAQRQPDVTDREAAA